MAAEKELGIAGHKVRQIYNGVDTERFRPTSSPRVAPLVIGTVGRMKAVKNQTLLCQAFIELVNARLDGSRAALPHGGERLRLGDFVLSVTLVHDGGAPTASRPVNPFAPPEGTADDLFDSAWIRGKPLEAPAHPVRVERVSDRDPDPCGPVRDGP